MSAEEEADDEVQSQLERSALDDEIEFQREEQRREDQRSRNAFESLRQVGGEPGSVRQGAGADKYPSTSTDTQKGAMDSGEVKKNPQDGYTEREQRLMAKQEKDIESWTATMKIYTQKARDLMCAEEASMQRYNQLSAQIAFANEMAQGNFKSLSDVAKPTHRATVMHLAEEFLNEAMGLTTRLEKSKEKRVADAVASSLTATTTHVKRKQVERGVVTAEVPPDPQGSGSSRLVVPQLKLFARELQQQSSQSQAKSQEQDQGRSRSDEPTTAITATNDVPGTDDEFQASLPRPWNIVPSPGSAGVFKLWAKHASDNVKTFTGLASDSYSLWRDSFIDNIHSLDLPAVTKATFLRRVLDSKHSRLLHVRKLLKSTRAGYKAAIIELERMYGGEQRMVNELMDAIRLLPVIRETEFLRLEKMVQTIEYYEAEMIGMDRSAELSTAWLYAELHSKMDTPLAYAYVKWATDNEQERTVATMLVWMRRKCDDAREVYVMNNRQRQTRATETRTGEVPVRRPPLEQHHQGGFLGAAGGSCVRCQQGHDVSDCPQFLAMTPADRKKFLREVSACFVCLGTGHLGIFCTSGLVCDVCRIPHHTLVHGVEQRRQGAAQYPRTNQFGGTTTTSPATAPNNQPLSQPRPQPRERRTVELGPTGSQHGCMGSAGDVSGVGLRTLAVVLENPTTGSKMTAVAMMDDGMQASAVSTRVATQLGLTGRQVFTTVHGINGTVSKGLSMHTQVRVKSVSPGGVTQLVPVQVMQHPAGPYRAVDWNEEKKKYPYLAGIPFQGLRGSTEVGIIIGNQSAYLKRSLGEILCPAQEGPIARLTPLGWTATGLRNAAGEEEEVPSTAFFTHTGSGEPVAEVFANQSSFMSHKFGSEAEEETGAQKYTKKSDAALAELVRRFWELEESEPVQETHALSPEEAYVVRRFKEDAKQLPNGQYEMPCTWKENRPVMQDNRMFAMNRLRSLENSRIFKQPGGREKYEECINDWKRKGYVEEVQEDVWANEMSLYWPHFAVVREDKTTTKMRIVLDGAARWKGFSINDALSAGPNLIADLTSIMVRLRWHLVAVSADIANMFLRIKLKPEDRRYHRFLWADSAGAAVKTYQFSSHVFGNAGSPAVANFVTKEHASRNREEFPRAWTTVHYSTLVDDSMDSVPAVQDARELVHQMVELYALAGMQVRKFASSHAEALKDLPESEIAPSIQLADVQESTTGMPVIKALGVIWVTKEDHFTFAKPDVQVQKWSKREMLRQLAKLFDPLGFLAPFAIQARMLFQETVIAGLDWDECLSEEILRRWSRWVEELKMLPTLKIPRAVVGNVDIPIMERQIHVFADASSLAYAAAAYVRVKFANGAVAVALIGSKAKVAPIKPVSIPRLELLAAELAVGLWRHYAKNLDTTYKVRYWSDSTNVVHWIKNTSRGLQVFVANRVSKIHQATTPDQWSHVPGELNPADLPSRGVDLAALRDRESWWSGPGFLRKEECEWPSQDVLSAANRDVSEMNTQEQTMAFVAHGPRRVKQKDSDVQADHFSSWTRLVRLTAWVLRWRTRKTLNARGRRLSPVEFANAEMVQVRMSQQEDGRTVMTKGSERRLSPVLDEMGVLRLHARLADQETVPFEQRCPAVLPKTHSVTSLIIRHIHESLAQHTTGASHTLVIFRRRFWVEHARQVVRSLVTRCVVCRRNKAAPKQQMMSPIHPSRVTRGESVFPFTTTSVDTAGPFHTKMPRGHARQKRYMLLFTCNLFRCVHIEMMCNVDTSSFLLALDRFLARRNRPTELVMDRGTNFVGAYNVLADIWASGKDDITERYPAISFTFHTPRAPHRNGAVERLIGSAKTALLSVLPADVALRDDELHTAFVTVEAVLNSRPLGYVSSELDDPLPLTPDHFLAKAPHVMIGEIREESFEPTNRWHYVQRLLEQFWQRFQQEYVPELQSRSKWNNKLREYKEDDVVAFFDSSKPNRWPLGLIERVHYSAVDGIARTVSVRVKDTIYERDVSKVALLVPVSE
jgi:hypothetical protein